MRSWLRHEQHGVRMALAAALHLRRQTTGTGARERDVYETHNAPRKTQHTSRPGLLLEPGPQRSDRTVWRSSPGNSGDNGVDGTTVSYILKAALKKKKKEEERGWSESGNGSKRSGTTCRSVSVSACQ